MSEVKKYVATGAREVTPTDTRADPLAVLFVHDFDYDQLKAANYLQEVRLKDAFEVIDQLKAENEWLGYEVERLGVVGLQQVSAMLKAQQESDTLRKQLDGARELLADAVEWNWLDEDAPSRESIDAWLEANKNG